MKHRSKERAGKKTKTKDEAPSKRASKDTRDSSPRKMSLRKAGTSGLQGIAGISAEAIIKAAPDYVLFTTRGLESIGGVDGASKLIGIEQTPAGKNRNIIDLDDLVLLGFGPRTAEGVVELAKKIQG